MAWSLTNVRDVDGLVGRWGRRVVNGLGGPSGAWWVFGAMSINGGRVGSGESGRTLGMGGSSI